MQKGGKLPNVAAKCNALLTVHSHTSNKSSHFRTVSWCSLPRCVAQAQAFSTQGWTHTEESSRTILPEKRSPTPSRNALDSRISGTRKGKPTENIGFTLPWSLRLSSARCVCVCVYVCVCFFFFFFEIDSYSLLRTFLNN